MVIYFLVTSRYIQSNFWTKNSTISNREYNNNKINEKIIFWDFEIYKIRRSKYRKPSFSGPGLYA